MTKEKKQFTRVWRYWHSFMNFNVTYCAERNPSEPNKTIFLWKHFRVCVCADFSSFGNVFNFCLCLPENDCFTIWRRVGVVCSKTVISHARSVDDSFQFRSCFEYISPATAHAAELLCTWKYVRMYWRHTKATDTLSHRTDVLARSDWSNKQNYIKERQVRNDSAIFQLRNETVSFVHFGHFLFGNLSLVTD